MLVSADAEPARRVADGGSRELGFEQIHLHHVGQDLRPFIDVFGERVLPELSA